MRSASACAVACADTALLVGVVVVLGNGVLKSLDILAETKTAAPRGRRLTGCAIIIACALPYFGVFVQSLSLGPSTHFHASS